MTSRTETATAPVSRRRLVRTLGVAATAGLAGCGSGPGDGDGGGGDGGGDGSGGGDGGGSGGDGGTTDLGERVPTVSMIYWTGLGTFTSQAEDMVQPTKNAVQNALGVEIEIVPLEIVTALNSVYNDERRAQVTFGLSTSGRVHLDPHIYLRRFAADWAGANGNSNLTNYADCEFSDIAMAQASAEDSEARREYANEGYAHLNRIRNQVGLLQTNRYFAAHTDRVDLQNVGKWGLSLFATDMFVNSSPTDGDSIQYPVDQIHIGSTNTYKNTSSAGLALWNTLVNSTLLHYDENFELQNLLARDYEVTDEGKRVTVELRDATFHNGDPVTAEDVAFTFELIGTSGFAQPSNPPYDSIDVVDDRTVEFNLKQPFPALITREFPAFGVTHKQSWVEGGGVEEPLQFEFDEVIGTGPFKVRAHDPSQILALEPHDGHPVFEPDHNIDFRIFQSQQSTFQDFRNGDGIHMTEVRPSRIETVEEELPDAELFEKQGVTNWCLWPQHTMVPTKFLAFRDALGTCINRQELNELAFVGRTELSFAGTNITRNHPWFPPEEMMPPFTDNPEGDPEAAKEKLRDAGWGWDSQGRLHYPPDADLSPPWPKGETPDPAEFPCLDSEGNYLPPSER